MLPQPHAGRNRAGTLPLPVAMTPRLCTSFARQRRGTAGGEFALLLPLLVLMIMGLADTVRRTLAQTDADVVAQTGALMAQARGFNVARIGAAMVAHDAGISVDSIVLLACSSAPSGRDKDKGNEEGSGHANGNAKAGRHGRGNPWGRHRYQRRNAIAVRRAAPGRSDRYRAGAAGMTGLAQVRRGTAAVEFALVAPVLVAILVGLVELAAWNWGAAETRDLAARAALCRGGSRFDS